MDFAGCIQFVLHEAVRSEEARKMLGTFGGTVKVGNGRFTYFVGEVRVSAFDTAAGNTCSVSLRKHDREIRGKVSGF